MVHNAIIKEIPGLTFETLLRSLGFQDTRSREWSGFAEAAGAKTFEWEGQVFCGIVSLIACSGERFAMYVCRTKLFMVFFDFCSFHCVFLFS